MDARFQSAWPTDFPWPSWRSGADAAPSGADFRCPRGALREAHDGRLDPRRAQAMASLAGAMVRVMTAGELEGRLRKLEERVDRLGSSDG